MKAAVMIQRWYRQYVARMEVRRRYTWNIFQSMEYSDLQDQIKVRIQQWIYEGWTDYLNEHCESRNNVLKYFVICLQLYNFLGYLVDNFTPSSSERKKSCHTHLKQLPPKTSLYKHITHILSIRKPDLTYLQREWGVSRCRVGEIFQLR